MADQQNDQIDKVQFSGGSNGAQITLPSGPIKSGVGMTKAELMKYANEPFWVRLRMFLFVLFWVVWLAMLFGAVAIIAFAPGCPATAKLPWWKKCSFAQISVQDDAPNFSEKIVQATNDIESLKAKYPAIRSAAFDGVIFTGVNPLFLQASPDNSTDDEVLKFKQSFVDLVQAVHTDGSKLIMSLRLSETPTSLDWFNKSSKKISGYEKLYIWRTDAKNFTLKDVNWTYNPDRFGYVLHRTPGFSLLNFGEEETKEKIKQLVIDWVRTRLDGIQADGDFYVDDGSIHISEEVAALFRKWIKTGGDNKAFFLENSKITELLGGADTDAYELSPTTSLWDDLVNAQNPREKLQQIFESFIGNETQLGIANKTSKDYSTMSAQETGIGWKSIRIQHPESDKNSLALKNGKALAEGVVAAFFMMPKVTPIVEMQADQLDKLANNTFFPNLHSLRKTHSETFLLGVSKIPKVSDDEVFAVQRIFYEKNNILLLINFGTVSKDITVSGESLPDLKTHDPKIVLVNSESSSSLVGTTISFPFKMQPKQVVCIEFVPKK